MVLAFIVGTTPAVRRCKSYRKWVRVSLSLIALVSSNEVDARLSPNEVDARRYLGDAACRGRFFFLTTLREPLARLKSHLWYDRPERNGTRRDDARLG